MRILVLKTSGNKQSFLPSKIARTVHAAGAGWNLARLVAKSVAEDLGEDLDHFSNQLVPTALIKHKVIRFLRLSSPLVARRYKTYRKSRV